MWGRDRGRLQTILPRELRSPNLERAQMRQRHAARIQRPHGLIPVEARSRTPRTRSRTPRTRSRTPRHTNSLNSAGWFPSPRPRDLLNPAGGLTEPTGAANIHVTKSPGTLLPRTARRIQRGKCPRTCFHTGRDIHTHKSLSTRLQNMPRSTPGRSGFSFLRSPV